jgi:hypothetical protein
MGWIRVFISLFLISNISFGQMDSVLLRGSEQAPQDAGLSSGRYEIREGTPLPVEIKPAVPNKKATRRVSSESVPSEIPLVKGSTPGSGPAQASSVGNATKAEPPSMADQVKDLVLGKEQPTLEAYKEQIHPDDIRLNRLEINVSPGYIYHESKSTYSYRSYQLFSPYVALGAQIWLTPFIGIGGRHGTSLGADVSEAGIASTHIPVTYEDSEVSIDFRRFFGFSRRSNSLKFGIYFSEDKFLVPGDNMNRVSTRSSGLGLKFDSRFPIAPSYAWTFGGRVQPRISHAEMATGLSLQSGESPQASRVGLNCGGEFKLSRESQIIWNLSFSIEKDQFTGPATSVDPETSLTPSGVSVTQTQSLFTLGYRWGH